MKDEFPPDKVSADTDGGAVQQSSCPPIRVKGVEVSQLPESLYIPPNALRVFLEIFEGPLDLLAHLIRKHNLDILSIDVAKIAEQYIAYIELMQSMQFTLAAEYLNMAAWLTELKSRYLLPRVAVDGEEEADDPRQELIARVLAYEQIRSAAQSLDEIPRMYREHYPVEVQPQTNTIAPPLPDTSLNELLQALLRVLKRENIFSSHRVTGERFSTQDRILYIRQRLHNIQGDRHLRFVDLFSAEESRGGLIVTLIAILEMVLQQEITLLQASEFGEIYLAAA